jgi:hypothetical protein
MNQYEPVFDTVSVATALLRIAALLLLVGSAWFAFGSSRIPAKVQISPDISQSGPLPSYCGDANLTFNQENNCEGGLIVKDGRTESLVFTCTTVWDTWVAKSSFMYGGESYPNLSGNWSPGLRVYGGYNSLTGANASCGTSKYGRVHLFWTVLAGAVVALVVSEVVRRSA